MSPPRKKTTWQGTTWTNIDSQLINLITPHRCTQSGQHFVLSFWVHISKHWNKTRNTLSRLFTKSPQHASRASHSLLWRCLYTLEDTYAIHVTPRKVTLCHLWTIQPKGATHGRSIACPQYETTDLCTQHITQSQCTKFRRTRQMMLHEFMCWSQTHTTQ